MDLASLLTPLRQANAAHARSYPGEPIGRQPVHTVYGGAHLFKHDTAHRLGKIALGNLEESAPNAVSMADCFGITDAGLADVVYARVREKLKREAIEDFRLDFEDGYGHRPHAEEDAHAVSAAEQVAQGFADKTLPPFVGIRIKPFDNASCERAARTCERFVTTLVQGCHGALPDNFVVTLPKVTVAEQVATLASWLGHIESQTGLAPKTIKLEIMVESAQAIIGAGGGSPLTAFVAAADGRCTGAHFGAYDYTAACNITAAHQNMDHPACDFARHTMQVALAQTGVMLSDGATNIIPVGPHRAPKGWLGLSHKQVDENRAAVRRAWRLNYDNVRRSLVHGFYQGWDLHPSQLAPRYAATYAFFWESLPAVTARLKAFVEQAAQATLQGEVFDDAATGQGLLNHFLRALACGAIGDGDVEETGLTFDEIRTRSFQMILDKRRSQSQSSS